MLVLTRRIGESIVIGDGLAVTVLRIDGGQVRIGIKADPAVPVNRQEVAERIAADRSRAERESGTD